MIMGRRQVKKITKTGDSIENTGTKKRRLLVHLGKLWEVSIIFKPSEPVSVSPKLKYEIKGDAVTITGFDRKPSGELTIPATIEDNPVTNIGVGAFHQYQPDEHHDP